MRPDYTIKEFAILIRRHPETLRRMARVGRLPGAYRIGNGWRISREAVSRLRGTAGDAFTANPVAQTLPWAQDEEGKA